MKNDNVLFGHAYQVGEFVMVRTSEGGEVKLPRSDVACWANSVKNLYQFRIDQRQEGDVSTLLRDAKWCIQNDLYAIASSELAQIRKLDPNHREGAMLTERLRRLTSAPSQAPPPVIASPVTEVKQASFSKDDRPAEQSPVDLRTLQAFARHVQPMLLNRCGRCHSQDSELAWRMKLPTGGARPTSQTTRQNLSGTMPFIDGSAPESSELLSMSTTAHGGTNAPLDPRASKAIRAFKAWLEIAAKSKPTSEVHAATVNLQAPLAASLEGVPSSVAPETQIAQAAELGPPIAPADPAEQTVPLVTTPASQPARLPAVSNPFDPEIFNRRFHMKTTGKE
ncbi:MAG: hypothetical protein AB8B91_14305 [Rubripirellula sp.]